MEKKNSCLLPRLDCDCQNEISIWVTFAHDHETRKTRKQRDYKEHSTEAITEARAMATRQLESLELQQNLW